MRPTRFTAAASVVATVSALLAAASPLVLGGPQAFTGSVFGSGVVGAVFAGYNSLSVREYGQPRLAAAVVAAIFGLWLVAAPLQYSASGIVVAAVQSFGMLAAAFGGYSAIEAYELIARGEPLATNVPAPETSARESAAGED